MIRPIIVAVATALSCAAAEKWIRVTSPNFELISTESEKRAREKILYFEQVREFFENASNARQDSRIPVRIVLFSSEKQYKPYQLNEIAAAFYQQGMDRDYIVMGGYLPESEQVAVHEYVHLMVRHSALNLPVWLNEGTAELYSNLRPLGSKVVVGNLIPGRLYQLQSSFLPLERLLAVGHGSAEYSRKTHSGTFYAESWALTHMLQLTPEYRPSFAAFYKAITSGTDGKEALEKTYGRPLAEIEKDLFRYVRNNEKFSAAVFPVKFEKANVTPEVSPLDPAAAKAMCLSILINGRRLEEAKLQLDELEKTAGEQPEVAEALAYAAWQEHDYAKARLMFERAMQNPKRHPKLLLDAAKIQMMSGGGSKTAIEYLRTVLQADPNWTEVRVQLAETLLTGGNAKDALSEIQTIKRVDGKLASRYFRIAAYAQAATGSLAAANQDAVLAAQHAKEMWDKEAAARLREYLGRVQASVSARAAAAPVSAAELIASAPSEREDLDLERPRLVRRSAAGDERIIEVKHGEEVKSLEGTLKQVDCLGAKVRMKIDTSGGEVALAIHDAASIVIRSAVDEKGTFELQCGPQKKPVRADYIPAQDATLGTQGILKIIEFLP